MIREENTENDKTRMSADLFRDRSPATVALDNLMRRKLRVSDPTNANEIADALGKLYEVDKEAMDREAAGLPFLGAPLPQTMPTAITSSNAELEQAKSDVERDLTALLTNALLKDIEPELRGWASTIRTAMTDGVNAARFALDPRQRDKTFAVRRLLGDYARIARYVGALTPSMSPGYRQLAKSLDEIAGVLLVLVGEALANIGFGGGRFLLQAPVSELQERRDAVIYALRNLIGSTQEAYGTNEWPRGLQAYRQFLKRLETSGQSDLKALFQENNTARLMDDLIVMATSGSSDGLRALGSTADLALERFRRLKIFGRHLVDPESPPLAAFLNAIQLFIDAFENASSGYRILYISRPPILFYGLYGIGEGDPETQRLIDLIVKRGRLADKLDCYLGCNCTEYQVKCQIMLDKVLYDLDRTIDLYALGTSDDSEPEERAAAYGFIIDKVLDYRFHIPNGEPTIELSCLTGNPDLKRLLESIRDELWYKTFSLGSEQNGRKITININGSSDSTIDGFSDVSFGALGGELKRINDAINTVANDSFGGQEVTSIPPDLSNLRVMTGNMHQELCIQRDAEKKWESLLKTMSPSCIKINGNGRDSVTIDRIDKAIEAVTGQPPACPEFDPTIPPHYETSLDSIAYDITRRGEGREETT